MFLEIPPQAKIPEGEREVPSQINFTQSLVGYHKTSLILSARRGRMVTLKLLRVTKFCILKWDPIKTNLSIIVIVTLIKEMEEDVVIIVSLNLTKLHAFQTEFIREKKKLWKSPYIVQPRPCLKSSKYLPIRE